MKRIVVIDDDEFVRTVLKDMLKLEGWDVEVASDGREGLEIWRDRPGDLLITDIYMPGLSGLELLKQLRGNGFTKPVIVITAVPENGLDERARALGACCILYKPFDGTKLVDCVDLALARP